MSSEMMWRATPESNEHEARDRATTASNLLEARWNGIDMDAKARAGLWLAFNCGAAYLKQFWNPAIGKLTPATVILPVDPDTGQLSENGQPFGVYISEDGQPLIDEFGVPIEDPEMAFKFREGDTDTAVRSIFNVRTNEDAYGLMSSEGFRWLIDAEVVPVSVVKERYGEAAKDVTTISTIATIRQHQSLVRAVTNRSTGESIGNRATDHTLPDNELTLLAEYWEAPTEQMPKGRLITWAGSELLNDGPLPQGFVPYLTIYDERRPFDQYGRPTVDDLIAPQKVINSQWGSILESMDREGIGQWATFDIPGLKDQITNVSGGVIQVPISSRTMNKSIGELIQRLGPGNVSADRWHLIDAAKVTMFDIGAFHEIQRGQVPPGVDSGIAVQLLQEQENGQLQDAVKTLKRSFIAWGRQTLQLARWGYGENEERWIPVSRPDLDYLIKSIKGTDLPDGESIHLDLEGFRPSSTAAFNAEIKDAIANQWISPQQGLKMMDLGRGIEGVYESEQRHYSKARRENLALETGEYDMIEHPEGSPIEGMPAFMNKDGSPFLLPSNDEHVTHIETHQEIALDPTRPWPTRQASILHIAEHEAMIQLAVAAEQAQLDKQNEKPNAKSK
ncbi:MAG TPA: hypothetical protein VNA25_17940 [Phycisphaerae bacterium]|nr:hypothetical protein [Phycisphaerae bacterium]